MGVGWRGGGKGGRFRGSAPASFAAFDFRERRPTTLQPTVNHRARLLITRANYPRDTDKSRYLICSVSLCTLSSIAFFHNGTAFIDDVFSDFGPFLFFFSSPFILFLKEGQISRRHSRINFDNKAEFMGR